MFLEPKRMFRRRPEMRGCNSGPVGSLPAAASAAVSVPSPGLLLTDGPKAAARARSERAVAARSLDETFQAPPASSRVGRGSRRIARRERSARHVSGGGARHPAGRVRIQELMFEGPFW